MSRTIELIHAGRWTSTQVVRLIRTLLCPSCEVRDVEVAEATQGASERNRGDLPRVRIDGRTVWLEAGPPGPTEGAEPATPPAASPRAGSR